MAVVCSTTVSSPALDPPLLPRLAASLAALALAAAALDLLGVAGYRFGAPVLTVALPVASGALASFLTHRRWAAAVVAVLGVVVAAVLASRAPWSAGRLESELDGLKQLDGFEIIETHRDGHSWCRPDCPSVTRTWRAPDTSPNATVLVMTLALAEAGIAPPFDELPTNLLTDHLEVRGTETDAVVTAERLEPGNLRVTVVLSSHR